MDTTHRPIRTLVLIWLAWALLLIGFQALATARAELKIPDYVLEWTAWETTPGNHDSQPFLLEPFMNQQVAYDSEFYLSIATNGYADPGLRAIWLDPDEEPELIWNMTPPPFGIPNNFKDGRPPFVPEDHTAYSVNYAFFPFYPLMIRLFSLPLAVFGLNSTATATLAGVIVSVLGALGGMIALYDLTRDELNEAGGIKAAFYLITFPTGFFLAMVHTEGLFVGLAFGSLALLRRKQWMLASLLAACATVTRAVGGALLIPFAMAWLSEAIPYARSRMSHTEPGQPTGFRWELVWKGVLALSPLAAFALWNALLGEQFRAVESGFFGRGALVIGRSIFGWAGAFSSLFSSRDQEVAMLIGQGILLFTVLMVVRVLVWRHYDLGKRLPRPASLVVDLALIGLAGAILYGWMTTTINHLRSIYYLFEFSATILALVACAYTLRSHPGIALFSLAVVAISFFSGAPQGMHRYILGAPVVFVMLGHLGSRDDAFDRAWTTGSILVMALFALLFAQNFWVG